MNSNRLSFPSGLLAAAALFAAVIGGVSPVLAQSTTIGFVPNADQNSVNDNFASGMTSANAWFVPFTFTTIDNYSLVSVSLLLSGNANLSDFSITATSTAATDLSVPSALATFSATGTLTATPTEYSFTTGAPTSLAENTVYYVRVAYTGPDTANWVKTSGAGSGSGFTGSGVSQISDHPVSDALLPGYESMTYRMVSTGAPFDDLGGSNEGLSITGSLSAIPEPVTSACIGGAVTLLAALAVRMKRRRSVTADSRDVGTPA